MEEYIDSDRKMATAIGAKDIRTTMIQNRCARQESTQQSEPPKSENRTEFFSQPFAPLKAG